MCEMIRVESSNINRVGWENNKLFVEYRTGTYQYDNVDRDTYLGLLGAKSRGKFMNENIKGFHNYTKIK